MGAFSPGHSMFTRPCPITWPRFRSLAVFFPAPLPRPRFLPALLTEITPFHRWSAGTEKHQFYSLINIKPIQIMFCFRFQLDCYAVHSFSRLCLGYLHLLKKLVCRKEVRAGNWVRTNAPDGWKTGLVNERRPNDLIRHPEAASTRVAIFSINVFRKDCDASDCRCEKIVLPYRRWR